MVKWNFKPSKHLMECHDMLGVRGILQDIKAQLDPNGKTPIPIGHGDPAAFQCFRIPPEAEAALHQTIASGKFNTYSSPEGLLQARRAVSNHLSQGLPYDLSVDDIYLTCGSAQAIDIAISVLASKGANILLPRPSYPQYEALLAYYSIEHRFYDLVPERGWEINVDQLHAIADKNTIAMIIINPNNPCGSVYTSEHLLMVAQTAKHLGFLIIADEVYGDIVFNDAKFFPMRNFASTVPVITIGSISKKYAVPGWRVGWLVTCDPHGVLKASQVTGAIRKLVNFVTDPATIIQAAIPAIIENTPDQFHMQMLQYFSEAADILYDSIQNISFLHCPSKPRGAMFSMIKIDFSGFLDLQDDVEFALKLAKEESVVVLPGTPLAMKNWIRVTFGVPPKLLKEALERMEAFCRRHYRSL
uniref:Aromatic aminotransferase 2 n=1 Tax=Ephedra sinica TaxID=33152 RepID=M9YSS8_EPHSI|nr:aromatic aminotransferase 2 [Ephedra sinica]